MTKLSPDSCAIMKEKSNMCNAMLIGLVHFHFTVSNNLFSELRCIIAYSFRLFRRRREFVGSVNDC